MLHCAKEREKEKTNKVLKVGHKSLYYIGVKRKKLFLVS